MSEQEDPRLKAKNDPSKRQCAVKAALDAAPSTAENSMVAGQVRRLIEKLQGRNVSHVVKSKSRRVFGPVPKMRKEARDAGPLFEIMKSIDELMDWTTQCLNDFNNDVVWKDEVLDPIELQTLLPMLRLATLTTRYDIHRLVAFRVQETCMYHMIFVLETRCHLFCFQREWMSIDPEEHHRLEDLPSINAIIPNGSPDPFLFMSLGALRHTCVAIADLWLHFTTDQSEEQKRFPKVDPEELTEIIYWLYSRTALLMNNAYEDDIMDEKGYVQQLTNELYLVNLDFMCCVQPFFLAVAQDIELFTRLGQRSAEDEISTQVLDRREPVERWLRGIIHAATADDLVNKYAQNYCEVEGIADVGASLRTETIARPEFHAHRTIEEHLEANADNRSMLNTIWIFVLSYMMEQQFTDLNFVDHIFYPRLNPRDFEPNSQPQSQLGTHPIITRIPMQNDYVVCEDQDTVIGVFDDILDAFLVWYHVLKAKHLTRLRHQTTNQWIDLSSIDSKIARASRAQRLVMA